MSFTYDSLFSGIGGFDLALERAGMACRRQVEIDKKCQQVLAHHWPDVERVSDVKKATGLKSVDLICGGFPCQDLSVAGGRAGLDGERSRLWFEFLRIINESKPQWVVIENVPGLLSSYSGDKPPDDLQPGRGWTATEESDLAVILQGLAESGYWWAYRVYDAQYFGVPQRRRRVFIVGHLGNMGRLEQSPSRQDARRLSRIPAQVLFESESSPWDIAPSREAGARVAGTLAPGAHPGGFNGQDAERGNIVYQCQGNNVGPMGTLRKGNGSLTGGVPFVAHPLAAHHGRNCGEDTFIPVAYSESGPGWWRDGVGCLRAEGENRPSRPSNVLAFDWQSGGDVRLNISEEHTSALQKSQVPAVQERYGVRRFTPLECERLQGFPDGHTDVNGMSDSARYKMLGNAVAVPVVQWIGERIMAAQRMTPDNKKDQLC